MTAGQTPSPPSRLDPRLDSLAWLSLAAAVIIGVAYYFVRNNVLSAAYFGFSPASLLHPVSLEPNFAADFPSGEAGILRSAVGRAYYLLGSIADGQDDLFIWLMVAVEAAALISGAAFLCRRLNPGLPLWTAIGGGVLLASGTIVSADLARWFHPVYGNVYNFAYAAGFVGLGMTLDRRMFAAGLAIGVAAAFHPIIAFFFGCAAGIVVLLRLRDYSFTGLAVGAAAAIVVFGAWYLFAIDGARLAGGVDGALFADLTRLMSSHWYPVSGGVFGERAWETLLPALGMLLIFAASLRLDDPATGDADGRILAAVLFLGAMTLCGVAISLASTSPLLLKLALHRASLVALLIAAALAIPRMLQLAVRGPLLLSLAAGALLLVPYWRGHGVPLLAAFVYAAGALVLMRGEIGRRDLLVILAAGALALAALLALLVTGHGAAVMIDTVAGLSILRSPLFVAAALLVLAARLLHMPTLVAVATAVGLSIWLPQVDTMAAPDLQRRARLMMDAQLWAKANTEPASVFMLDPTMSYGWRQYSERPSFGVLREWLYSGWLYDTDPAVMAEGLRRAATIGLDVQDYARQARTAAQPAYDRMIADAGRLFYAKDGAALEALARANGIAYFVMDSTKAGATPALPVVYRNDGYVILKP